MDSLAQTAKDVIVFKFWFDLKVELIIAAIAIVIAFIIAVLETRAERNDYKKYAKQTEKRAKRKVDDV